jgi:hypothetical protein
MMSNSTNLAHIFICNDIPWFSNENQGILSDPSGISDLERHGFKYFFGKLNLQYQYTAWTQSMYLTAKIWRQPLTLHSMGLCGKEC